MILLSILESTKSNIELLKSFGIQIKIVKNFVMGKIPLNMNKIPWKLQNTLQIIGEEYGGSSWHYYNHQLVEQAVICCDLNGEPLEAIKINLPYDENRANAYFLAGDSVVTINVISGYIELTLNSIDNNEIIKRKLWSGWLDNIEIDPKFNKFFNAAKAAIEKSKCKLCNCIHYQK